MKHAYVFPGQGAQFSGMGKDLYENNESAKALFEKADEILGFRITDIMFGGTADELKQTKVTQPAVFLHSVILAKVLGVKPDAVAGHSLGEFSALVVSGAVSFEDGLRLVSKRAMAMQKCCENRPGSMAAILGLDDAVVEQACADIDGVVVAANYNCPGQLVISGADEAVDAACARLKEAGARRALRLPVGGAFHSPLMEDARAELEQAIAEVEFHTPVCPIYQNVDRSREDQGEPHRPAHGSRALDADRAQHARRRRDGVHRAGPGQRASGSYQEGGRRGCGGVESRHVRRGVVFVAQRAFLRKNFVYLQSVVRARARGGATERRVPTENDRIH